jgi:hypothetical protein
MEATSLVISPSSQPSWLLQSSGEPRCPSWRNAEGNRQTAGHAFFLRRFDGAEQSR